MPRHFFPPEEFAPPYRTVALDDLRVALMSRQIGRCWPAIRAKKKPRRPMDRDLQRALAVCDSAMLNDLKTGSLVAHAYVENIGRFRRITNEYWREELCGATLGGALLDFDSGKGFSSELEGSPVVVLDIYAVDWLTRNGIDESHRFFPESLLAQKAAPARPAQTHYDWDAFEFRAVERLHYQGGYVEIWAQRHLVREMRTWCEDNWDEEGVPDIKLMRKHVKSAHQRYLREQKGILRNPTNTLNGATAPAN